MCCFCTGCVHASVAQHWIFEEFQASYWKESKQWDYVQASTVRCMIAILREDNQIQQSDNTWSCIKSSFQSCCIIM